MHAGQALAYARLKASLAPQPRAAMMSMLLREVPHAGAAEPARRCLPEEVTGWLHWTHVRSRRRGPEAVLRFRRDFAPAATAVRVFIDRSTASTDYADTRAALTCQRYAPDGQGRPRTSDRRLWSSLVLSGAQAPQPMPEVEGSSRLYSNDTGVRRADNPGPALTQPPIL